MKTTVIRISKIEDEFRAYELLEKEGSSYIPLLYGCLEVNENDISTLDAVGIQTERDYDYSKFFGDSPQREELIKDYAVRALAYHGLEIEPGKNSLRLLTAKSPP